MAEAGGGAGDRPPDRPERTYGWREVLLVAAAVVATVLGLAVLTSILPEPAQEAIFRTPLTVVVLVVGTAAVLLALVRRRPAP